MASLNDSTMMSPPDATLVIPQRNRGELTVACLESLRRQEQSAWPVIVVDDGSSDPAPQRVRQVLRPADELIAQTHAGVTHAWNRGITAVTTPFVVLMNNDVLCHGPGLDHLLAPLRTGTARITGAEARIERWLPPACLTGCPGGRLLSGWCLAFAKDLWTRLGGFDESLRLYWSDTDFQCRAGRLAPGRADVLLAVDGLPFQHLGHQTTRDDTNRQRQWHTDRLAFLRKWTACRHPDVAN